MEDTDGSLSFDFEGNLDTIPNIPTASNPVIQPDPNAAPFAGAAVATGGSAPSDQTSGQGNRRSFRQTVCRHWLRSLCMKGDSCGFLHQYDKSRMPVCRFFRLYGECREQDCVYKHTNEDIKECNMYKLGFCPNGPDCRYRHAKQPGPPPAVDEVLQKIQQLTSYSYGVSNRFSQQRNTNYSQQADRSQFPQGANTANQGSVPKSTATESSNIQQQLQQPHLAGQDNIQNLHSNSSSQTGRTATPLPKGITRYFIVKSCNRENLELSVQQGVWATQRSNEAKLNEAFDTVEHVILVFSVNRTRHFQGCAKMTSKIGETASGGNWKHAHGTAHYGRNFSVKWLKLCELSFNKTRHLRNPYNENLPVKISRDCQELEPSVGEQLASLLYLEPDGELMVTLVAAESKREEEKAKGVDIENGAENPDIVPFEDNEEEEEEEESEEEDESFGLAPGSLAIQGRGRGRGMMWPPNFPMGRGGMRPMPGMRGFPPGMMGVDGFNYGPGPDNFPMPDPFGMGPRPFVPYSPRFSGEFTNPSPGMMFPGRPSQPGGVHPGGGFGMMMGPGRAPFMPGGMGIGGRGGRPMGMPPIFPSQPGPPQGGNRGPKRDIRGSGSDWGETFGSVPDQGKLQDMSGRGDDSSNQGAEKFVSRNSLTNDDSESEDEAPRRSRHGEGKKKRRSLDGDVPALDP
ncbi:30-kDa cleavage and polyadenylation specificity factor 30-like [Chenopodium quinoa]|nr:30-kDa cleavage and polyadenylation specificity factor 30-like [Chenopodium quinoa]